jgi:hypothetical protein
MQPTLPDPAYTVKMMDLCTKTFFDASAETHNLEVRTAKNGRRAFVAVAPTERANLCWKWASGRQIDLFSGTPLEPAPLGTAA